MVEGRQKTYLIVGLVAAAAGVALASYVAWRGSQPTETPEPEMRHVTDILSDCYAKMRDLETQLAAMPE